MNGIIIFRILFVSIGTILASLNCVDASFAGQDQKWVSNGPYGGEVWSIAVDPVSSDRVYTGTAYGGVFKSIEGGLRGVPITIGQIENVTSISIDPLEPQNVYAGNWQELYTTSDYGETWTKINDNAGNSITMNPLDPDIIYVTGNDDIVYKTINGGQSWEAVTDTLRYYFIVDMAIDPKDPDIVYVLMDSGIIFKTMNAGSTWSDTIQVPLIAWSLVVDPNHTNTLYVGGWSGMGEGRIAKSTDGGDSWVIIYTSLLANSWVKSLAVDPSDSDVLFAGTAKEILRSINGGQTWEKMYILSEDLEYIKEVYSLYIDPQNPNTVYAGLHAGGVLKSVDGGFNWFKVELGYPFITVLTKDPQNESLLYAGCRSDGIFRSTNGGKSWLETELKEGWMTSIEVDPVKANLVYATAMDGVYKSIDYGSTWARIENGLYEGLGVLYYAYSIAVNPYYTDLLLLGTGGEELGPLYKSTDAGESWTFVTWGSFSWITIDPTNTSIVYANIGGRFGKSFDSGLSWSSILPEPVTAFTMDPVFSNVLYAGLWAGDNFLKSTDAGSTWTPLSEGLSGGSVMTIRIDPSNSHILFIHVSSKGIYKTTDGGVTWEKIDPNLPFNFQSFPINLDHTLVLVREGDYLIHAGTKAGVWSLSAGPGTKGDVNRDGNLDILDVVRVVNMILGFPPSPTEYELWAADFNGDGEVNVLDVVGIVNKILNPILSTRHFLGEQ